MQRVRTSLPYFMENGWEPTVVAVDERHADMVKDELLMAGLPPGVRVIKVSALNKTLTAKLGLGSIALRSYFYYRQRVDELLDREHFDLIYFSTTQFPVCALGPHWKRKFKVPYVIDMQDPWYSVHYSEKPKDQRPPKYRLIYSLHKMLERMAMMGTDGLISVSQSYVDTLRARYRKLEGVPFEIITFGAFYPDLEIAALHQKEFAQLLTANKLNVVYIGRGGEDMHKALRPVFEALKIGLDEHPEIFHNIILHFIGTSYAPAGTGVETIAPLAKELGVAPFVKEKTDRISYYHALTTLLQADAVFIPGSDHADYTASKIYTNLLTKKPLLAVLHEKSSAVNILQNGASNAAVFTFNEQTQADAGRIYEVLKNWAGENLMPTVLTPGFNEYSAKRLTAKQTGLFNLAIQHFETAQLKS